MNTRTEEIVDYSESFPEAIVAHGLLNNVLILRKLDKPVRRVDKKQAMFEIEYRWLSRYVSNERDEAWCCVEGNEFSYWQADEIDLEAAKDNLFAQFDMIS